MRTGTVVRKPTGDTGTHGVMVIDDRSWVTLEPPWRNNVPELSCFPAGTYILKLMYSHRFGRNLYHFQNVPGRKAIELHPMNWAGDIKKGYKSDTEGCMGLGHSAGDVERPDGVLQDGILGSKASVQEFMDYMNGEDLTLTVEWQPGVSPEVVAV